MLPPLAFTLGTFAHHQRRGLCGAMESNDFDGAMRQKERVRAPRRRQVQENEDEESVRRTSQVPPCPAPLSDTHLPRGGRVCLWAAPRSQDGETWTRRPRALPPPRRAGAVARSRRKRSPRVSDLACENALGQRPRSNEPLQRARPAPRAPQPSAGLGPAAGFLGVGWPWCCVRSRVSHAPKPSPEPDPHAGSRTIRSTTRTRTTRAPR